MANTYDMKWAEYSGGAVSADGENGCYYQIQIDFAGCKAASLIKDMDQKPDKLDTGINQIPHMDEKSVLQLDEEYVEQLIDELTSLIDTGGIAKGSEPDGDYTFTKITIYNKDDIEIYCCEFYGRDIRWDEDHDKLFELLDTLYEEFYL